jgi:hypothetical protein
MLYQSMKTHKRNADNFYSNFCTKFFFPNSLNNFLFKMSKVWPIGNIARPGCLFFLLLIWAAVGKIDFLLAIILNL